MNNNREKEIAMFGMEKQYVIADFEMLSLIHISDAQASMDMCNYQDARQYLNQAKLLISHNNKQRVA